MKRIQAFEFCDQPWLKGWLREAYFDCLSFVHHIYQPYYKLAAPIAAWGLKAGQVLDIGSGSGEHIAILVDACKKLHAPHPQFVLSDLYPDYPAFAQLQKDAGSDAITYIDHPVSAYALEGLSQRYWSLFTAFHHFAPADAKKLLQELSRQGDSLCIVELTQRNLMGIVIMLLGMPINFFVPFFAKKFAFRKLLFTTFIPIIPLMVMFDGIVSVLRSYTVDEIWAMLPPESQHSFALEYREVYWRLAPYKSSMATLTRKTPAKTAA